MIKKLTSILLITAIFSTPFIQPNQYINDVESSIQNNDIETYDADGFELLTLMNVPNQVGSESINIAVYWYDTAGSNGIDTETVTYTITDENANVIVANEPATVGAGYIFYEYSGLTPNTKYYITTTIDGVEQDQYFWFTTKQTTDYLDFDRQLVTTFTQTTNVQSRFVHDTTLLYTYGSDFATDFSFTDFGCDSNFASSNCDLSQGGVWLSIYQDDVFQYSISQDNGVTWTPWINLVDINQSEYVWTSNLTFNEGENYQIKFNVIESNPINGQPDLEHEQTDVITFDQVSPEPYIDNVYYDENTLTGNSVEIKYTHHYSNINNEVWYRYGCDTNNDGNYLNELSTTTNTTVNEELNKTPTEYTLSLTGLTPESNCQVTMWAGDILNTEREVIEFTTPKLSNQSSLTSYELISTTDTTATYIIETTEENPTIKYSLDNGNTWLEPTVSYNNYQTTVTIDLGTINEGDSYNVTWLINGIEQSLEINEDSFIPNYEKPSTPQDPSGSGNSSNTTSSLWWVWLLVSIGVASTIGIIIYVISTRKEKQNKA